MEWKPWTSSLFSNDNLVLYSVQGKHTTAWGVFRTSSSDCSYFLAFQDEQFHLGFTKEETLTAAVVPAENKTRKAGKHVEEDTILKVRKAGCLVAFVKSQTWTYRFHKLTYLPGRFQAFWGILINILAGRKCTQDLSPRKQEGKSFEYTRTEVIWGYCGFNYKPWNPECVVTLLWHLRRVTPDNLDFTVTYAV